MTDPLLHSAGKPSDFHTFLVISEEIRKVVDISRQIALVATNALLTTRQAGKGALGFGVVSSEMHAFSTMLQTMMDEVRLKIFKLNNDLADWHKQRRTLMLFQATRAKIGQRRYTRLDSIISRKQEEMESKARRIDRGWNELHNELKAAFNLCLTGKGYGRNAKIEAAYGLEFGGILKQVAEQIEITMNEILNILQNLLNAIAADA